MKKIWFVATLLFSVFSCTGGDSKIADFIAFSEIKIEKSMNSELKTPLRKVNNKTTESIKESGPKMKRRVLESAKGLTGEIIVAAEGDDLVLLVNDVVQGRRKLKSSKSGNEKTGGNSANAAAHSHPRSVYSGHLSLPDPLAQLAVATHKKPRKALLIGLGTGKTAMDLQNIGLQVESVEIEPKIIEFARKYFGFRGKAFAADGADFIKTTRNRYDVIILDAFEGLKLPKKLVSVEAIENYRKKLAPEGTILMRMYGDPESLEFISIQDRFNSDYTVFGELPNLKGNQFLYIVFGKMYYLDYKAGISLFQIYPNEEYYRNLWISPKDRVRVTITGFILKYGKDKTLILDLPHMGMGASRVVLKGNTGILSEKANPVNREDNYYHEVINLHLNDNGGESQYSPAIAMVSGRLKTISIKTPFVYGGILPKGGTLYELDVESTDFILDAKRCNSKVDKNKRFIALEQFKNSKSFPLSTLQFCSDTNFKISGNPDIPLFVPGIVQADTGTENSLSQDWNNCIDTLNRKYMDPCIEKIISLFNAHGFEKAISIFKYGYIFPYSSIYPVSKNVPKLNTSWILKNWNSLTPSQILIISVFLKGLDGDFKTREKVYLNLLKIPVSKIRSNTIKTISGLKVTNPEILKLLKKYRKHEEH
ncbi:fused MFS/spermidine synthase [Myxococcota bacterium]|nr:fused MFS/spermidine synthase [Myxococcota bacterium]MBU1382341.1 fused MFS/spermidine synthase [Myxococcota bacterium]MBU1496660.1 fused MFS/spermidine synthase [Myxococcota bacterium]